MSTPRFSYLSGSFLVIMILMLGVIGSGLTVWNYSRHVFSSAQAKVIDAQGLIEAFFRPQEQAKLHLHDRARVTLKEAVSHPTFQAEVIFLSPESVTLKLVEPSSAGLVLGAPCCVTIDTTIPSQP